MTDKEWEEAVTRADTATLRDILKQEEWYAEYYQRAADYRWARIAAIDSELFRREATA